MTAMQQPLPVQLATDQRAVIGDGHDPQASERTVLFELPGTGAGKCRQHNC